MHTYEQKDFSPKLALVSSFQINLAFATENECKTTVVIPVMRVDALECTTEKFLVN